MHLSSARREEFTSFHSVYLKLILILFSSLLLVLASNLFCSEISVETQYEINFYVSHSTSLSLSFILILTP